MFQIGEFSRLARVTIDTLRHYDAIGLLKPAKVDSLTGYRYYKAAQLQTLNQIHALKELGLSLEEITRILRENLGIEDLRGIMKAQLAQAESAIEAAQSRRQLIISRLQSLEEDAVMPAYEVSLKSAEALLVAAIREKIAKPEQIPQRWNELFTTIASWLKAQRLPVGIPMALYHDEAYVLEDIDTECAFIIPNAVLEKLPAPPEPIVIRQMEAIAQLATIVVSNFHLRPQALSDAYAALGRWVADNGYHIIAAPRELYYGSPETGDFASEIQFPVSRQSILEET